MSRLILVLLSLGYFCVAQNVPSKLDFDNFIDLRKSKFIFLPFYRVPAVAPNPCTTPSNEQGICYSNSKCKSLDLTPAGTCNSGVCCIASKTCDQASSAAITYFKNPATLPQRCSIKISRTNSSIVQLRLDFLTFSLSQPTNGKCSNFLSLSPTDSTLPKICGENTGSHVYVNFDPLCEDHALQFNFADTSSSNKWNIKITQIARGSPIKAPDGCLMYYSNTVTGSVRSFNFGTARATNTRQISPLNYGICIQPLPGFCQIKWTASEFLVSSDTECLRSYVEVPCSVPDTGDVSIDRFCGSSFPNPSSSCRPYVLYVVTNVDETDVGTTGFSLNYQQISC